MTQEFSSIVELISIRTEKSRLTEREMELAKPRMTDFSLIPELYRQFKLYHNELSPKRTHPVIERKKFLCIILFLFSPSSLAGGRMQNGLRIELSKLFPEISPHNISKNIVNITFLYQRYKGFRADVDSIYRKMING